MEIVPEREGDVDEEGVGTEEEGEGLADLRHEDGEAEVEDVGENVHEGLETRNVRKTSEEDSEAEASASESFTVQSEVLVSHTCS